MAHIDDGDPGWTVDDSEAEWGFGLDFPGLPVWNYRADAYFWNPTLYAGG